MDKRSSRGGQGQSDDSLFRIAPYFYLHVLDQNSNVTRLEIGPKTYVRQDNEKVNTFYFYFSTKQWQHFLDMLKSCFHSILIRISIIR